MSNECRCCGGRCNVQPSAELSRRDFMEKLAAGTAAMALAGDAAAQGKENLAIALPSPWRGGPTR